VCDDDYDDDVIYLFIFNSKLKAHDTITSDTEIKTYIQYLHLC